MLHSVSPPALLFFNIVWASLYLLPLCMLLSECAWSPQIYVLKTNLQGAGVRWDLWKVIKSPFNPPLWEWKPHKRGSRYLSCPFPPCEDKCSVQPQEGPHLTMTTLTLDYQSPELWVIHLCCFYATEFMAFCYISPNDLRRHINIRIILLTFTK